MLRLKESQLRNKLQNKSKALIYSSNIPQASYRTLSNNNLNDKLLNKNNNNLTNLNLLSQYNSSNKLSEYLHSGKNLSSKLNNLSRINNNNNKNRIKNNTIKNYSNSNINYINNNKNTSSSSNHKTQNLKNFKNQNAKIFNFPLSEKQNSDFENLENFENENYEADNLVLYRSMSPKETKITSNFLDNDLIKENKIISREALTPQNFMNNINININHLNSSSEIVNSNNNINNKLGFFGVQKQRRKINHEKNKNKSCDFVDEDFVSNGEEAEADDCEAQNKDNLLSLCDDNHKTKSNWNKNELNEAGSNSSEKLFSPSQKDFNRKQMLIPSSSNFNSNSLLNSNNIKNNYNNNINNNYNNCNSNSINVKADKKTTNFLFKNQTNKKKQISHSLTLQEIINKKLQNNSIISNLPAQQQYQQKQSLDSTISKITNNTLEHSFSNIINVNVNLENEAKASFPNSSNSRNKLKRYNSPKENSLANKDPSYACFDEKAIFSRGNTTRAAEGSSLSGFPGNLKANLKGNNGNSNSNSNNYGKFNSSHKKTQSLSNLSLLYSTHTERLASNSLISSDNNNNNLNSSKTIKRININVSNNNNSNKNISNKSTNKTNKINHNKNNNKIKNNEIINEEKENNKSKSKPKHLSNLNDLTQDNNLLAAKPGLNTAKAGFHRITKSHNNLDFLKSEKKNLKKVNKNNNKKETSEFVKIPEAKERIITKSSGKVTRREPNSPKKIKKESENLLEIKTNLQAAEFLEVSELKFNKESVNFNNEFRDENKEKNIEIKFGNVNSNFDYENLNNNKVCVENASGNNINNNNFNNFDLEVISKKELKSADVEAKSGNLGEKNDADLAARRKSVNNKIHEGKLKI